MSGSVLFIDDEPRLCDAAAEWLTVSGFTVATDTDALRALERLKRADFDCIVTDVRMPRLDGLEVLARIVAHDHDLPVVMLTGHGDVAMAVQAMRAGAYDFLEKPYDADHLVAVLIRAVEQRRVRREVRQLRSEIGPERLLEQRLAGSSPAMIDLRHRLRQLADIDVDVLVTGETGTGKEVVARALHDFGPRAKGPFVAINCAAVPESLFESEIFGHEKGAFTGAGHERIGKLEFASGGTVFLDEIESMPASLQAKILRVVQERKLERLGSNRERPIDVRLVAASKTDLRAASEARQFRADLYFRLATVELGLPPLRERTQDIPLLHGLFAAEAARRFGVANPPPPPPAETLLAQRWPGNVRELKAAAERWVLRLAIDAPIPEDAESLSDRVARFEAAVIQAALEQSGGSTAEAAERLGIPRRTLNEKIQRHGLRVPALDA